MYVEANNGRFGFGFVFFRKGEEEELEDTLGLRVGGYMIFGYVDCRVDHQVVFICTVCMIFNIPRYSLYTEY